MVVDITDNGSYTLVLETKLGFRERFVARVDRHLSRSQQMGCTCSGKGNPYTESRGTGIQFHDFRDDVFRIPKPGTMDQVVSKLIIRIKQSRQSTDASALIGGNAIQLRQFSEA